MNSTALSVWLYTARRTETCRGDKSVADRGRRREEETGAPWRVGEVAFGLVTDVDRSFQPATRARNRAPDAGFQTHPGARRGTLPEIQTHLWQQSREVARSQFKCCGQEVTVRRR